MHDPEQGFLYFVAGVASWRRHPTQRDRWLLRVDIVCHEPAFFVAANESDALLLAEKMADGFEAGMAADLMPVGITRTGRTLYGSLPSTNTTAAVSGIDATLRLS